MRYKRHGGLQVLIGLLVFSGLGTSGQLPRVLSQGEAVPFVIRLFFKDRQHLDAVAGELDIWEVHHDAGFAVVSVTPTQYEWLEGLGYQLDRDAGVAVPLAVQAPLDPRFYYFDNRQPNGNGLYVVDFLQDIASAYPNLTALQDIGDGWQAEHGGHHRDLWMLRISNEAPSYGDVAAKPAFVLLAEVHAREVATTELAIRYIRYLTTGYNGQGGYGQDPDVTWLVDHHVAYILVMFNPDGHAVNEASTSAFRRKNLDSDDGCTSESLWGVDLNRNHSFFWNRGGSSGYACDETFLGPGPASEPESLAFQAFFGEVMQDQNGEGGDYDLPAAASEDATGILITLHSYGDLVLWPWGHTASAAPNSDQLRTIGRKFAYHNGYDPRQAAELYTASGTTDDWTYGRFGVASFTFEVGPGYPYGTGGCAGFFPAFECIDGAGPDGHGDFWPENQPALVYAHKIARTPYLTAYGPDAVDVAVTPALVPQGAPVQLTVTLDDTRYSSSNGVEPSQDVVAAEYTLDVLPWQSGSTPISYPLVAVDGTFDGPVEQTMASIDTSDLDPGRHILFVRGRDADDHWGAISAVFLAVTSRVAPGALDLEVSPSRLPIGQGRADVTATLTRPDGSPAPGWPVTFASSGGMLSPPFAYSDASGQAITALLASDSAGSAQVTAESAGIQADPATVEFYVPDVPTAGFGWKDPVCVGTPAIFTNTTASPPLASATYFWDFGDGATSAQALPVHSYGAAGTFTVTLTAENTGGTSSHTGIIIVKPLPQAHFVFMPSFPAPGSLIHFGDRSTGSPDAWTWDFGDGSTSSAQEPFHAYAAVGSYQVTLRVRNDCGWSDPAMETVGVTVNGPPYRFYFPIFHLGVPF